jgi:DNA-binding SARP family transcriptional activator
MASSPPQLRLIGPPMLQWPDGRQQALGSRDALLLGRLAQDGAQDRQRLADWLWPDTHPAQARTNLRQRLLRLRRTLGCELARGEPRLMLDPHLRGDWHDPLASLRSDARALCGDWLDGVPSRGTDASGDIDAWLLTAREHWRSRCHAALLACADAAEHRADPAAALPYLQRLCSEDPLHEGHHRRLMRLHLYCGERSAALAAYARLGQRLRVELALAPAPQTAALARQASISHTAGDASPCFDGTAVPVRQLFEVLQSGGASLDDFLHRFPCVSRPAALGVLRSAQACWLAEASGG